jgi:ribosome-associated protein
MQPNFRQYYHLEELWGEKPVRLKLGSAKPAAPSAKVEKAPAKVETSLKRSNAAKKGVQEAFPSKAQLKKTAAAKSAAAKPAAKKVVAKKPVAKPAVKTAAKTVVVKAPVKVAAKKAPAKKSVSRKA